MTDKRVFYGIIGIIGAFGVGIGEFLLHYNPAGYGGAEYSFLLPLPVWRTTVGHFLSVLFLPLYFAGFWSVYLILKDSKSRLARPYFIAALYVIAVGGVWIGSRSMLTVMVQAGFSVGLEKYTFYLESLLQVLRAGILGISILFSAIVWGGKTMLPRWTAFFNEIVLLLLVFSTLFILPPLGRVLVPSAMNVAHLIFFGMTTFFSVKNSKR